jgi:arginine decarboxylase
LNEKRKKTTLIGNRVPKDYFVTSGSGESDIQVHAGSYHLALKEAGIEAFNIICYSSIMPAIATEIKKPAGLVHGCVMETISAVSSTTKGKRATAAIIYGWLYDRKTKKKYGGLVCEYNGNFTEEKAEKSLRASLQELYTNGFEEQFTLQNITIHKKSCVPKKKFGTALVAVCFVNYEVPILE